MLIQIKNTDYILGVWMVEKINLGKVFVFSTKVIDKDEWLLYIRYNYIDQNYNLFSYDNNYKNTILYKNISEIDIIKICNNKIDDLSILFNNNKNKIFIKGDIYIYNKILDKNPWLPTISLIIKKEKRR